jgi:hypothetical protein
MLDRRVNDNERIRVFRVTLLMLPRRLQSALQNPAPTSVNSGRCTRLAQAMQKVISGPAYFQSAMATILILVSMNERAWSRAYGEDERDRMIKYCEVQLDVIKGATLPSSELKFRLHNLFFAIHSEVTRYHGIIDFAAIFNMLASVFAVELDVQLRYDILADQHGQLLWDLAEDRLRRREVAVGGLHKVAGPPDPYLLLSLRYKVRKRKAELALMESEFTISIYGRLQYLSMICCNHPPRPACANAHTR